MCSATADSKDKENKDPASSSTTNATATAAGSATATTVTPPAPPEKPVVTIKEWSCPRGASTPVCTEVHAQELEWLVPGLHRLWLGQMNEDKNRRLRAFLSSLNSDVPLMLNTSFVPQHLIIMCSVLRYVRACVIERHYTRACDGHFCVRAPLVQ